MFNSTLLKNQFNDFLAPECDRALFISNILEQGGLSATTIHVDDKKHIYVKLVILRKKQINQLGLTNNVFLLGNIKKESA